MAPPERKKLKGPPVAPAEATHWTLQRVTAVVTSSGTNTRHKKCTSPPLDDGTVPEVWPVTDFSVGNVLKLWGDGKYRVEWYGADDERIGGQLFEVAKPAGKSPRLKRRAIVDDDQGDELEPDGAIAAGGGMGFMQIMALLDRNTERAERREEQKAERDRQFFMQMQQQQIQLLQAITARPAGGDSAERLAVLEQRLGLQIDQAMFRLERRMSEQPEEEPDETDPDEAPADIGEAGEKIALRWLSEIEKKTPELMGELLPRILTFLQGHGIQPSDELQARINAARQAANGRAHA